MSAVQAKRTRRWIKPLAIGVAVVVVLVVVPALFAVQPAVIGGRGDLKVAHETLLLSKHGDVPCQGCHADPKVASQAGYGARMLGQLYLSFVGGDDATASFPPPSNAACLNCHKKLVKTSPKGDLLIPHRAHVDILKVPCVTCHRYLVHEESPEGRHTPPMAVCLTCHDGKQAKNACTTCHTAKAAPDTHKASDWLVVHPQVAKTTDCAKCHGWIDNWCADCHDRRPPSHTKDWRERHATAVAVKKPRNCESCHVASFCTECHGSVPELNRDPNATRVK